MTFKNTAFEYQFWTVPQLQKIGLTPEFASSFNYFVRDVAKINNSGSDLEDQVNQNTINIGINSDRISDNEADISYNFIYLNGQVKPSDYVESNNYVPGNYTTYQDRQYRCVNNTTGGFSPVDWQIITLIGNDLRINDNYQLITDNTADITANFEYLNGQARPAEYDDLLSYVVGDVISNGNTEEICYIANPPGVKDPADWRKIGVVENAKDIISIITTLLSSYQYVAYGGLYIDTPPVAIPNIGAAWADLDIFDTVSFATSKNITQNLLNSSLSIDKVGVYEVTVNLVFDHDESNAGRTVFLRVYNLTDNTPTSTVIPIFIARNQPGTNFAYSFPFELLNQADEGKELILQIGGGDALANISFETAEYYIKSIGEYRGEIL